MGVTIDSIQIEIESSSTNAAQGIDALATSLEKLKKNGSFKTVSKNLNELSQSLKGLSNVHSASNALRTLANSIEKLKGAGTVAGLSNSLKKLPDALKSISNLNLDRIAPQLQNVASAVAPISAIKAGGLNTMVNSFKKLGEVTKSLDDKTIAEFASRVELLNQKLGPFAQKMETIKTAFGAINTNARAAARGVAEVDTGIKTSTLNMSSFIQVAETLIQSLQRIVQGFSNIVREAIEWDGVAARFGRGFGPQAQETYEWIQRLNEEMGINIQQFMKYSSIYATMLTGFGVANEDAAKMALGYTELTYDIWAGYNDIYKTFDEASEAVRSAISGEIEPIRRAGFSLIESTLKQTAANHGLEISLENATEAQKSYLRYLTLVDQAQAQNLIGTYAKEMNTAEGLVRTLAQQIKSLTQAFGSLFLPILAKILPYLQAFVELLTDAVYRLAEFFGIDIQRVDFSGFEMGAGAIENVGNSAGNATDALESATKAAKDLKNATLGIDELNVISPTSASGSGGANGGTGGAGGSGFEGIDVDSLWDESIFDTIQSNVDSIKSKLEGWLPILGGIATMIAGMKFTKLIESMDDVDGRLTKLGKGISLVGVTIAVGKLVWDFTGAYLEGGDEADLLKALGTTALGAALAYYFAGKPGASLSILVSGVVTLSRLVVDLSNGSVELGDPQAIVTAVVGGLETVIGAVFTWKTLGPIVKKAWPKIAEKAAPALAKAGPYAWIATAVVAGITLALVDYDFTDIGKKIGEKIGSAIKWVFESLGSIVSGVADALDIDSVWDALYLMFVPGAFGAKVQPILIEWFLTFSDWMEERVQNLKGNIAEFFRGLFDGIFESLGWDTTILDNISKAFDFLDVFNWKSIGSDIIGGILEGFRTGDMFGAVVSVFMDFVDKIKTFFGIHSPSTLMRDEIGKNLVAGMLAGMSLTAIQDRLSAMWTSAKTWWDTKKANLASYTPSIGNIATKLSSAWDSAKTWWGKKSGLASYTPSIGSIYNKLKERWDNARIWWNDKKTKAKEYTPSIGSIYEKVYERWKNARDWWNGKKGSFKTYTPSIGSIVDKVKSAWNTAKNWWNKNVKLSTKLNIQVPTIKVKWDTASAFGKSFKYPTGFSLKFAANGGIFDQGSLIWAGERGPEVMARAAGGKTGVMNVQQMQDAVYEGVYAAVSAAMRGMGGGGTQAVNVYLDGRQITSTVEQRQRERGASIMGNEVYSY